MSGSSSKKDDFSLGTADPRPVHKSEEESAKLCNKWVNSAITKNKSIQFLLKTLIDSGCEPPEKFIRCMNCEQPAAGGFGLVVEEHLSGKVADSTLNSKQQCHRSVQDLQEQIMREQDGDCKLQIKPEIYLCQQYMEDEKMTHKTLHHELIHAIDMCRTNMDPLRNCIHMACTEIRAENLSGECGFWKELPRMEHFKGHGQACVRRRAILSVRANPNCTGKAEEYVDAAMNRCYRDHYPYDRHPNQM
jgi:inner membrane protease ATP23